MLAADVDLATLRYPVLVSPKLDGVRATFVEGRLLTRSLKEIPNKAVAAAFKSDYPLDGELIVGAAYGTSVFRDTVKVVSAFDAPINELKFHVFDIVYEGSFTSRLHAAHACIENSDVMVPVPHLLANNESELLRFEESVVKTGFEGAMIRDPKGLYKFGRATSREGTLLKLKRRLQAEARIIGFEEQMHNANPQTTNALGYAERTSHQANKIPTGLLGALVVRDLMTGVEFNVGTGFDIAERATIWKTKSHYLGKVITYEYLAVGVKDKPRHPTFIGWRMMEDVTV